MDYNINAADIFLIILFRAVRFHSVHDVDFIPNGMSAHWLVFF